MIQVIMIHFHLGQQELKWLLWIFKLKIYLCCRIMECFLIVLISWNQLKIWKWTYMYVSSVQLILYGKKRNVDKKRLLIHTLKLELLEIKMMLTNLKNGEQKLFRIMDIIQSLIINVLFNYDMLNKMSSIFKPIVILLWEILC